MSSQMRSSSFKTIPIAASPAAVPSVNVVAAEPAQPRAVIGASDPSPGTSFGQELCGNPRTPSVALVEFARIRQLSPLG